MGRGRDVGYVERLDVPGVPENAGELSRVELELFFAKGEASQAGNVGNVLLGDRLGHLDIVLSRNDCPMGDPAPAAAPRRCAGLKRPVG